MSGEQREDPQKRISFDFRGENAVMFEEFRSTLAARLGFDISASKVVLWAIHRLKSLEESLDQEE